MSKKLNDLIEKIKSENNICVLTYSTFFSYSSGSWITALDMSKIVNAFKDKGFLEYNDPDGMENHYLNYVFLPNVNSKMQSERDKAKILLEIINSTENCPDNKVTSQTKRLRRCGGKLIKVIFVNDVSPIHLV